MFGYVRAFKPYLRMFEYDIYKSVYCGLCKDMGRRYGFITRFTLSYDFTFLALMDLSVKSKKLEARRERCIAHPMKKTMCAVCGQDFAYSSSAAVILTYHKLKDDFSDKGFKKKAVAFMLLPFFRKPYKKACSQCSGLSEKIESAMILQNKLEKEKCAGIDQACEPTALMMKAVFGGLTEDRLKKEELERFGYLLGRYIYITDALDDLKDDFKDGDYNPLLADKKITAELSEEIITEIHSFTDNTINMTLGAMADSYVMLELKRYKDILDNIIYLGLKYVYSAVRNDKFRKQDKKGTITYEQ